MRMHELRVVAGDEALPPQAQLAWRIAEVAADAAPVEGAVRERVVDRLIDATAVAVAALTNPAVVAARAQAVAHPRAPGATVLGQPPGQTCDAEWAAWANGVAVRDLDFNDSFFGLDTAHPSDNISAQIAVAQQCGRSGADLVRAIATAYEVQIALARSVPLIPRGLDQSTHLAPAITAGLGALLGLDVEVVYQAVQQAAHCAVTPRQARKGTITSWKAYVPAFAAKLAIEALDRAMRGERSPAPVYEGAEGLVAVFLGGPEARYRVPLPEPGAGKRAILETYPKAHPVGYASQAFVDLAIDLGPRIGDLETIESVTIHTCRHHHAIHGSGAGDREKMDPAAPRETLDHSIMYAFAVALQDGRFHHRDSYAPERAARADTVRLWQKVRTVLDPEWDAAYEHAPDELHKVQGGRVEIRFADGSALVEEIRYPHAHPLGARPFGRAEAIAKLRRLADGIVDDAELDRFLRLATRLPSLSASELRGLTVQVVPGCLPVPGPELRGIF